MTYPLASTAHVWASQIMQKDRAPCSVIYDLRRADDFDFHVLCLSADRQSMHLESYLYAIKRVGSQQEASLIKSTCRQAEAQFKFTTQASQATEHMPVTLSLISNGEYIMLQQVPDDDLVDDLKTATTLHGKPVTRGCFSSPSLDTFVADEAAR